jgi:histidine triad (HIT) family protein
MKKSDPPATPPADEALECVFCEKIRAENLTEVTPEVVCFEPLNPVTPGHLLLVPKQHVADISQDTKVSLFMGKAISLVTREYANCNVITSKGTLATQTVFHLHVHIVPRTKDDGLLLPWSKSHAEQEKPKQVEPLSDVERYDYNRLKMQEQQGLELKAEMEKAEQLTADRVLWFINQLSPWNLKTSGNFILEAYAEQEKAAAGTKKIQQMLEAAMGELSHEMSYVDNQANITYYKNVVDFLSKRYELAELRDGDGTA